MGFSYRQVGVDLSDPTRVILSPDGTDELPSIGASFRYDTRDLREYPKDGIFFNLSASKLGFGGVVNYASYQSDLRYYHLIFGNVSIATRLAGYLNSGTIPVYGRVFLGYGERIRGHFSQKREGDHRLLTSVEMRFPIIKTTYFDLDSGPDQFRGYSNNLKFGISGGIFFDSGAVWYQHRELHRNIFLSGFGAGLHFHLPYVDLIRVEYALDTYGSGEFIFDVGKSF